MMTTHVKYQSVLKTNVEIYVKLKGSMINLTFIDHIIENNK